MEDFLMLKCSMHVASITFVRGARRVTGSNFLVEAHDGEKTTRIVIDCGLTQGTHACDTLNTEPFSYDPALIDALFLTHAHADHLGLIPKFVKHGGACPIYTTEASLALAPIMLEDTAGLIMREAEKCGTPAPYARTDIVPALDRMKALAYEHPLTIAPGITATLYNAGHILGSATVLLDLFGTRVLFTGDLGRVPAIIVPDRVPPPPPVDYLITESVYGNRVHEDAAASEKVLKEAVVTVVKEKGTLLIPSFSLERTQIILAALDRFVADGTIPAVPVYMDSPLAAKVTDVYRAHPTYLRDDVRTKLESGDDPFAFPSLTVVGTPEDSADVDGADSPKVIIAGAGMSHGGRIRQHEAAYLPRTSTTLLLVGYQVPGSLGRRLKDGATSVVIDGESVEVKAKVIATGGFSAHADRDDLVKFAEDVKPREAFVVLGEMEAASFLAQRLSGFLSIKTIVPQEGERYELDIK